MKRPETRSAGLPPRRPQYQVESAADALGDSPLAAPIKTSEVSKVLPTSETSDHRGRRSPRPARGRVERTFRLPKSVIAGLRRIRDRYNADRTDDAAELTLDSAAEVAIKLFLQQDDPKQTIERLRTN